MCFLLPLFTDTCNLRYSLKVKGCFTQLYRPTDKIIVFANIVSLAFRKAELAITVLDLNNSKLSEAYPSPNFTMNHISVF
jgi:hypothetical protein